MFSTVVAAFEEIPQRTRLSGVQEYDKDSKHRREHDACNLDILFFH